MDINEAFGSAYAALITKPSEILPFYFMSVSVPAVARVAPLLTGVLVYAALLRRGNIDEIRSVFEGLPLDEFEEMDNPESFEGFEGMSDDLAELADLIFVPEVVALLVASFVVFAVVLIVLNAVVSAGQVSAVYAVLTAPGDDAVERGVEGVFAHSSAFVLLVLLEIALILAATAVLALVGAAVSSVGGLVGTALVAVVVLLWLLVILLIHTLFIFTPQSVVIDGNGARGALRGNLDFVSENPVEFIAYVIFVFVAVIGFGSVVGFLNVFGAPTAATVLGFIVFSPFIAAVKTDMYARHAGDEVSLSGDAALQLERLTDALRDGWDEMVSFTASHIALIVVSAVLLLGSAWGVWQATVAAEVGFETSIADRLAGTSPLGEFVNYTANNWSVAVAQSYAGFVFGVATVVSLVFNGAVLGFLTATEQNPAELLAFVAPHGVIEIPALLISGALGLRLAAVAVGYLRGGVDVKEVTSEVKRAYAVLVGLFVLFVAAGFIEAFISPYYYGPLLGI